MKISKSHLVTDTTEINNQKIQHEGNKGYAPLIAHNGDIQMLLLLNMDNLKQKL